MEHERITGVKRLRTLLPLGMIAALALLVYTSATGEQAARPADIPCAALPEARQFDFWVGEWDVTENGKPAGTNSVRLILNQCVVFENWTGVSGGQGKSFNFYNRQIGRWQQLWVDDRGAVLPLTGEFRDGAMRFTGETLGKDKEKIRHRLTFFPLTPDRIRQLWEQSYDDGATWKTVFDGLYVRKK